MKKIILFITAIVFGKGLLAQQRYAYLPEGKTIFETSQQKILMGFKKGFNNNSTLKNKLMALVSDTSGFMQVENKKWNIFTIKSNLTNSDTINSILAGLRNDTSVLFANKFLIYNNSTLQGLTDQVIVRLKTTTGLNTVSGQFRNLGVYNTLANPYIDREYILTIDPTFQMDALTVADSLFETGLFDYCEPEFIIVGVFKTTDPLYVDQWNLQNTGQYSGTAGADIKAYQAWCATTGAAIRVAVEDEGVDLNQPDLQGNLSGGYDALGRGSNGGPSGDDAHGTACAGIIAAVANNNLGIVGVAYSSKIVPVRVGTDTMISTSAAASGISWAAALGPTGGAADIISCSWGGGSTSSTLNTAIANAIATGRSGKGCVVLFAAGNDNLSSIAYPSNLPNVIAVGGTNMCDQRFVLVPPPAPGSCNYDTRFNTVTLVGGSNYGTGLGIVAPGINIATTDISGTPGFSDIFNQGWIMSGTDYVLNFDGTSASCPHAAAVIALILSINPALTFSQATNILESTADKTGGYSYSTNLVNGTWNNEMGYGRINAANAANKALSTLGGIIGSNYFCSGSSSYSVPTDAKVTWSVTGSSATLGCTSCNTTTLTKVSVGSVILTATLSSSCSTSPVIFNIKVNVGQNPLTLMSGMQGSCNGTFQTWLLSENPGSSGSNYQWSVGHLNPNSQITINNPNSSSTTASVSGGGAVNVTYTDICGIHQSDGTTIYSNCHSFAISPNPANNTITISSIEASSSESSFIPDYSINEPKSLAPTSEVSAPDSGIIVDNNIKDNITPQSKALVRGVPLIKSVTVYDVNGKLIKRINCEVEKESVIIITSDMNPGVYFVHIYDGINFTTKKLIINR